MSKYKAGVNKRDSTIPDYQKEIPVIEHFYDAIFSGDIKALLGRYKAMSVDLKLQNELLSTHIKDKKFQDIKSSAISWDISSFYLRCRIFAHHEKISS